LYSICGDCTVHGSMNSEEFFVDSFDSMESTAQ
jgi:hypothetical protein